MFLIYFEIGFYVAHAVTFKQREQNAYKHATLSQYLALKVQTRSQLIQTADMHRECNLWPVGNLPARSQGANTRTKQMTSGLSFGITQ